MTCSLTKEQEHGSNTKVELAPSTSTKRQGAPALNTIPYPPPDPVRSCPSLGTYCLEGTYCLGEGTV